MNQRKLGSRLIRRLTVDDWRALDSLRLAYALEMETNRSLVGQPGFSKSLLLQSFVVTFGAFIEGELTAFAVVFRLPEAISGTSCGLLDDLFVMPVHRRKGLAQALILAAFEMGRAENWSHLRWLVPTDDKPAINLYNRIADQAPWLSFIKKFV